jgi:uncharacterized protein YprB with RNaseH-like and TPR domain
MSTLAERLRGVVGSAAGGLEGPPRQRDFDDRDSVADMLGGEWRGGSGDRYLVVDRKFLPGHRHGQVAVADSSPPWPQLPLLAGQDCGGSHLVFLDLETTGIAGGAGTYAFLVGLGRYDGGTFRTRQFFLSTYTAERALLEAVASDAGGAAGVVTYNGKSFDLPLMETRFVLHRMATPFAGLPHVDMLHPARRLWRADEESREPAACRLTMLEETLCGHRREGDVPGFEIPSRYFHYVRTGDARPLHAVLEHNRLDLLALAMVTAHAARLLEDGPAAARTCREALGLGRLYERAGRTAEASACYLRADDLPGDAAARAEGLRAYAVLARRARRYADAADAWRRVLSLRRCPPLIAREATEALAVHHEHRARDLAEARRFALRTLQFNITMSRQQAVQHRLARLDRKLGEHSHMPLFQMSVGPRS